MNFNFLSKHQKDQIIFVIAFTLPVLFVLAHLKFYSLTFWYDPARDLLAAWDNLSKLTLIGPPTGIPGLHYGPYWIWLLSFGLLFSKDPVIVTFITAAIPYLIIFPLVWFRLHKFFDRTSLILGWLLFIMGDGTTYATNLWNLFPAPFITLTALTLILLTDLSKVTKKSLFYMLISGILLGIVVNVHIGYGITLLLGTGLFLLVDTLIQLNKKNSKSYLLTRLQLCIMLLIGIGVAFLPTGIFEIRHGFYQTKILLFTLSKYGNVVVVKGLNQADIFNQFLKTLGNVIHVQGVIAGIVFILLIFTLLYKVKRKDLRDYNKDIRIGLLAILLLAGSAIIFFTAKNPVWTYHFIGVDISFLLFVTYASSKIRIFKKILLLWTIIIIPVTIYQFVISINNSDPYFIQQKKVVKTIAQDANGADYSVYAYSKSIYMYEYSYFFRWLAGKNISYDPGLIKAADTNYLIVPAQQNVFVIDFIHFRAPAKSYKLVRSWKTPSGIEVLKYIQYH